MMTSLPHVEHHPSPNHGERAAGKPVDMLILHYTGMIGDERALKWLCDPESGVSSHYLVFEDGRVARLVDEDRRAWHAGKSSWNGESDINSRSVGIEIGNPGHEFGYRPFPDAQIASVILLCRDILSRHAIKQERVLAHSDVAPQRKEDPGELFPWARLHDAGIGHWLAPETMTDGPVLKPGDQGEAVAELRAGLRQFGYGLEPGRVYDAETEAVVRAFQRHFRQQRIDGIADVSTVKTLDRLSAAMRRK